MHRLISSIHLKSPFSVRACEALACHHVPPADVAKIVEVCTILSRIEPSDCCTLLCRYVKETKVLFKVAGYADAAGARREVIEGRGLLSQHGTAFSTIETPTPEPSNSEACSNGMVDYQKVEESNISMSTTESRLACDCPYLLPCMLGESHSCLSI